MIYPTVSPFPSRLQGQELLSERSPNTSRLGKIVGTERAKRTRKAANFGSKGELTDGLKATSVSEPTQTTTQNSSTDLKKSRAKTNSVIAPQSWTDLSV
jgi:hypothetical protein